MFEEYRRNQFCAEANLAPKYSGCFDDLADFLGLSDEITLMVASLKESKSPRTPDSIRTKEQIVDSSNDTDED